MVYVVLLGSFLTAMIGVFLYFAWTPIRPVGDDDIGSDAMIP